MTKVVDINGVRAYYATKVTRATAGAIGFAAAPRVQLEAEPVQRTVIATHRLFGIASATVHLGSN
jgi:hypothetical protein